MASSKLLPHTLLTTLAITDLKRMGGTDKSQLWPADKDDTHIVHYCFSDKTAAEKLEKDVTNAVNAWGRKIGGPMEEHGHSLLITPS
jgi:hypothetical protein